MSFRSDVSFPERDLENREPMPSSKGESAEALYFRALKKQLKWAAHVYGLERIKRVVSDALGETK